MIFAVIKLQMNSNADEQTQKGGIQKRSKPRRFGYKYQDNKRVKADGKYQI
jgi:hypothetical protein